MGGGRPKALPPTTSGGEGAWPSREPPPSVPFSSSNKRGYWSCSEWGGKEKAGKESAGEGPVGQAGPKASSEKGLSVAPTAGGSQPAAFSYPCPTKTNKAVHRAKAAAQSSGLQHDPLL